MIGVKVNIVFFLNLVALFEDGILFLLFVFNVRTKVDALQNAINEELWAFFFGCPLFWLIRTNVVPHVFFELHRNGIFAVVSDHVPNVAVVKIVDDNVAIL